MCEGLSSDFYKYEDINSSQRSVNTCEDLLEAICYPECATHIH